MAGVKRSVVEYLDVLLLLARLGNGIYLEN